jgi:dihydroflavonol-4-reductase
MSTVLVTGGSGFVGSHCLLRLLNAGYRVRTTLRDLTREAEVRLLLKTGGVEAGERLSFFAANLESDAGWAEAAAGCAYVLHVASPFPVGVPRDKDELIVPARDGARRVLRASRDAGVKRVVLTSSFAAIGYGHAPRAAPFDETSWTDTKSADVQAYIKSKTLAERAAWDFIAAEGRGLELCTINPVGIFGPTLGTDLASSVQIVRRLLDGEMRACPRIYFGVVDVRDVADLHVLAMTHPAAKGERFIAVAGENLALLDVSKILRARLGPAAAKAPEREMPDWLMRLCALLSPAARGVIPQLGKIRNSTAAKAKSLLGWNPRSREDAIVASGESLIRLRLRD